MTHDHQPSLDAVPVARLGLDTFETGLLALTRHFMTSFAQPQSQAWQAAFAIATERWGIAKGPQIAQGLLAVIQALRQARSEAFNFSNPLCVGCREMATGEEASLCLMLHAMRRDQTDQARGAVMDLAEGRMDASLIQCALAFAARFPAEKHEEAALPAPHISPSARHLRLVH